jgi:hypothetical protein
VSLRQESAGHFAFLGAIYITELRAIESGA